MTTTKGSLVARYRPNSDCSGVITHVKTDELGQCVDFPLKKHSIMTGVYEKNGVFYMAFAGFDGMGCKGEASYTKTEPEHDFERCMLTNRPEDGLGMMGVLVSPKVSLHSNTLHSDTLHITCSSMHI
jgi:hypothetical protein